MPGSPVVLRRAPARNGRTWTLSGMVHGWSRQRAQVVIKMIVAASLTGLCMFILGQSSAGGSLDMAPITSPSSTLDFSNWDTGSLDTNAFFGRRTNWVNVPAAHNFISRKFSRKEDGVTHVMVTGGAGYIGSHAALRLLQDGYRVTIVDNLSRGNMGAVDMLRALFPKPGHLQFLYVDLGDSQAVQEVFAKNAIDAVMHFAAVAYVGESMAEPLRYYHNITSNTLGLLEAMVKYDVKTLIYSSTCATYGEPETMPITETTPQVPINPYGKAKKMAEDIILDYSKINPELSVMILRYFNVIGSDPKGRLGEAPRPELRAHGRISGACFDAAMGQIPGLKVHGQDYKTEDGTCIRDYIHVTDLVDAHVKALKHAMPNNVGIYNVGTGKGRSVKEFVEACIKATGVNMTVSYLERRAGDYAEVYSDSSKIQRELNWTAQHLDLTETLNVAWKWRQAHPNGY